MKQSQFDFQTLGESLRADTQEFIDTYAAKYPEDGPILAFCLYFESTLDATGMMLPQRATSKEVGASISDTASWFYYDDHVQASLSEPTLALFEAYSELCYDEDTDTAHLPEQFKQMISQVMQQLDFAKLPRTPDFIYFAEGMDEEYDAWKDTIPPALLKKHFRQ
ncbi:hypothetical protein [Hymenobacter sp. CRA2]|uniref:hypothetical protein n=1 Tax=Hymenobacter sp. CRA2 TaxID=1955620 RepID=UPI0009900E2C|nr:hypothetical protein [Hymenobacter sp. CRA2]OON68519.1 hypothetical protein B0919_12810 [Hymenobacter sp. CRA2]